MRQHSPPILDQNKWYRHYCDTVASVSQSAKSKAKHSRGTIVPLGPAPGCCARGSRVGTVVNSAPPRQVDGNSPPFTIRPFRISGVKNCSRVSFPLFKDPKRKLDFWLRAYTCFSFQGPFLICNSLITRFLNEVYVKNSLDTIGIFKIVTDTWFVDCVFNLLWEIWTTSNLYKNNSAFVLNVLLKLASSI